MPKRNINKSKYKETKAVLNDLMNEFMNILPKDIFTEYQTVKLKFKATPERKVFPVKTSGRNITWYDKDKHEVEYLSGLLDNYPDNFTQVGKPKKASYSIGQIDYKNSYLTVLDFNRIHEKICRIWLKLEGIIRNELKISLSFESHAFCRQRSENSENVLAKSTPNDLRHLRDCVIDGLELTQRLINHLSNEEKSGQPSKLRNNGKPYWEKMAPKKQSTIKERKRLARLVNEYKKDHKCTISKAIKVVATVEGCSEGKVKMAFYYS